MCQLFFRNKYLHFNLKEFKLKSSQFFSISLFRECILFRRIFFPTSQFCLFIFLLFLLISLFIVVFLCMCPVSFASISSIGVILSTMLTSLFSKILQNAWVSLISMFLFFNCRQKGSKNRLVGIQFIPFWDDLNNRQVNLH